jgi:hypothetical protein
MSQSLICCASTAVIGVLLSGSIMAASFSNLDFEDSTIPLDAASSLSVPISQLFPSWTVRYGNTVYPNGGYNMYELAGAKAALMASASPTDSIIEGTHSLYMQTWIAGISIAQVGDVPGEAKSLRFFARNHVYRYYPQPPGPYVLQMDGQIVPLVTLSSSGGDLQLGADVSAWAGQTAELRLVMPPFAQGDLGFGCVDAFTFSAQPLPEPNAVVFAGAILVAIRRRFPVWGER